MLKKVFVLLILLLFLVNCVISVMAVGYCTKHGRYETSTCQQCNSSNPTSSPSKPTPSRTPVKPTPSPCSHTYGSSRYESTYPYLEYKVCTKCGKKYYTGGRKDISSPTPTPVKPTLTQTPVKPTPTPCSHTYGNIVYESTYPYLEYKICNQCGHKYYTGGRKDISSPTLTPTLTPTPTPTLTPTSTATVEPLWTCTRCGQHNFSSVGVCSNYYCPSKGNPIREYYWQCSKCLNMNPPFKEVCWRCMDSNQEESDRIFYTTNSSAPTQTPTTAPPIIPTPTPTPTVTPFVNPILTPTRTPFTPVSSIPTQTPLSPNTPTPTSTPISGSEPIAIVSPTPSPRQIVITSITGPGWERDVAGNPAWDYFLQVPYAEHSGVFDPITVNGNNLDLVNDVELIDGSGSTLQGYTLSVRSKTNTRVLLDIKAVLDVESEPPLPKPVTAMLRFNDNITENISLIPAFNMNCQVYGQCTWYAGYIARIRNNQSVVPAYSMGKPISGNSADMGFPKKGSVLMMNGHMAYVDDIRITTVRRSFFNMIQEYEYTIYISHTNWSKHDGSKETLTATMTVIRVFNNYSIKSYPFIGSKKITAVYQ